jgi:hypothetical protein
MNILKKKEIVISTIMNKEIDPITIDSSVLTSSFDIISNWIDGCTIDFNIHNTITNNSNL